jgi:D-alanine-D-alanine ligase
MNAQIKILIVYNEPNPDFYYKKNKDSYENVNFIPYFEVDNLTPMEEYEIIADKLKSAGYKSYTLNIFDNLQVLLNDIKKNKPDIIFNFIEIYKENSRYEMNIVGLFEILDIPYTGSPPLALSNCQSKILTKRLLNAVGINTPNFKVFSRFSSKYSHNLRFPLMVKPAFEDASVGIENESIVRNNKELKNRIEYVLTYFAQPVLVEEYIKGRELNIAILGNNEPKALPISEIDFTEMPDHLYNIVSYQAKWEPMHEAYHKTIPICPAKLPKKIELKAKQTAVRAYKSMGCRDYARVDMRLANNGDLFVLEVNPNPDLTEGAGFMRSSEAAGYSYSRALRKIVKCVLRRNKNKFAVVKN